MAVTVVTDQGGRLPARHHVQGPVDRRGDIRGRRRDLLVGRRIGAEVPLGHPDAAHVDRDRPGHREVAVADDELG
jgi:hypothetical protein